MPGVLNGARRASRSDGAAAVDAAWTIEVRGNWTTPVCGAETSLPEISAPYDGGAGPAGSGAVAEAGAAAALTTSARR